MVQLLYNKTNQTTFIRKATAVVHADSRLIRLFIVLLHDVSKEHSNLEIIDTDIRKFYDAKVSLSATYTITVYATKTGYDNSDVATATLCWIDAEPKTEGLEEDAVTEVKALPVLIQTEGSLITVRDLDAGTEVSAYSTNGMLLDSAVSAQGTAILRTSLTSGSTAIIKIGQKAVKVMVK